MIGISQSIYRLWRGRMCQKLLAIFISVLSLIKRLNKYISSQCFLNQLIFRKSLRQKKKSLYSIQVYLVQKTDGKSMNVHSKISVFWQVIVRNPVPIFQRFTPLTWIIRSFNFWVRMPKINNTSISIECKWSISQLCYGNFLFNRKNVLLNWCFLIFRLMIRHIGVNQVSLYSDYRITIGI